MHCKRRGRNREVQRQNDPPQRAQHSGGSQAKVAVEAHRGEGGAVLGECRQREDADEHGVRIEEERERPRKVAGRVERHAAQQIPQCDPENEDQERARGRERGIPKLVPHPRRKMLPQF